jgi:hypothetical protein
LRAKKNTSTQRAARGVEVTPTASEHPRKTSGNATISKTGDAESDVCAAREDGSDQDLSFLVGSWWRLPDDIRECILDLAKGALQFEN